MPSLSNTLALAALVFGVVAGCAQPAKVSITLECEHFGQGEALRLSGILFLITPGSTGLSMRPNHNRAPNTFVLGKTFAKLQRSARCDLDLGKSCSLSALPISSKRPYLTPDGQVVSQLRQLRQRSKWMRDFSVNVPLSKNCLIR